MRQLPSGLKRHRSLSVSLLLGLCVLSLLLAGCGSDQATNQHPTQVPIPPLPPLGMLPDIAAKAQAVGLVSPTASIQLTIGLATNRQALADDLTALYDPNSPQFGQFLSPADIASRYSAPQSSIEKVTAFLQAQGFTIVEASPLHDSLRVTATIAQIAQTFHVALQVFQQNGSTFFGPTGQFSLPPEIQALVTSVVGLSSFVQPQPHLASPQATTASCGNGRGVSPNQVATAYRYADAYKSGYTGKGIGIAALEFNDNVSQNDLKNFLACTTGGKLHYQAVAVAGGVQSASDDATGEAELDLEYLSALAPDAQLVEYQTSFCRTNSCPANSLTFVEALIDELHQIAQDGKTQVASLSWGGAEAYYTRDEFLAVDQAIARLAAEGITLAIATGDCAAFGLREYNVLAVQFPASDPYALAVGGTLLRTDSKGQRTAEPAWSDRTADTSRCNNSWGSGGGVSNTWKQPAWQKGPGVKNASSTGARQLPDVAAIADNLPLYLQGQWYLSGGTSAAAPIWIAGIALVDQGLLQHHKHLVGASPTFYQLANKGGSLHPYFDITQGDNLYYQCTPGWDYPTGWGTPNILDFGKALGAF